MSELSILTTRETDVVECLLSGQTAKQTARQLVISPRTVERHLENIKEKLSCKTKFELVRILLRRSALVQSMAVQ